MHLKNEYTISLRTSISCARRLESTIGVPLPRQMLCNIQQMYIILHGLLVAHFARLTLFLPGAMKTYTLKKTIENVFT